jgi:hypothetical protein
MDARSGPEGRELFVDSESSERGTDGPFFVVYSDVDGGNRWGYFCGNCESFSTAMDSMGRIKCNDCQNLRKPDEWDAAHE